MSGLSGAQLDLRQIRKNFGPVRVLGGVSLAAAPGELVCLLGASGSGKSTLLRIVAGLEQADAGTVLVDGRDIASTPVHLRGFGFMFQEYALFPHKNVAENIAFGLHMQNQSAPAIARRVAEMLALVNLPGYEKRDVARLSGGEKQRVALARSLAPNPRLLMLDEPLGSLDRLLRDQLCLDLRGLIRSMGMTALYVTHDQAEAFTVADRIVLLRDGCVVQAAPPAELYLQPSSAYVARFMGHRNLVAGRILQVDGALAQVDCGLGNVTVLLSSVAVLQAGQRVWLIVRPDAAVAAEQVNTLALRVRSVIFRDGLYHISASHSSGETLQLIQGVPPTGDELSIGLDPARMLLIGRTG